MGPTVLSLEERLSLSPYERFYIILYTKVLPLQTHHCIDLRWGEGLGVSALQCAWCWSLTLRSFQFVTFTLLWFSLSGRGMLEVS